MMKTALVTGGSRGIGKAIAQKLSETSNVAVGYSNSKEQAVEVVNSIQANGGNAIAVQIDVTDNDSVEKCFELIEKEFSSVEILVNNAGIFPKIKLLHEIDEEEWNEVLDVNLTGQFRFTKQAIPYLQKTSGCIINISSDAGLKAYENFNVDAYSASKAALIVLTKCWALEYAKDKIRINCICPGVVDTDMTKPFLKNQKDIEFMNSEHPLGRIGQPEEIGKSVLYFASDDALWITGAILTVDGGESIK